MSGKKMVQVEMSEETLHKLLTLHDCRYGPPYNDGTLRHMDDVLEAGLQQISGALADHPRKQYLAKTQGVGDDRN